MGIILTPKAECQIAVSIYLYSLRFQFESFSPFPSIEISKLGNGGPTLTYVKITIINKKIQLYENGETM